MQQAEAADALLAQGTYLGPLHGIPYGLKDIVAVPGYPTTWGCVPFQDQVIAEESNVYTRCVAGARVCAMCSGTGLHLLHVLLGCACTRHAPYLERGCILDILT